MSKSPYNTKSFAYPMQSASNMAGMHPYMPSLVQSPILSTSPDDERTSSHVLQSLARARGKSSRSVNHYVDKSDVSLTSNLRKHAKICWGDDVVKAADEMKDLTRVRAIVVKLGLGNASIMAIFE